MQPSHYEEFTELRKEIRLDSANPIPNSCIESGSPVSKLLCEPLILAHPSIGCFVNHCGFKSMWESLVSDCQIVLLPYLDYQVLNTRFMTEELEVSVEVKREGESGDFSKESLSNAIMSVMDKDSELRNLLRRNYTKLKEILVSPGLLTGYTDKFVESLQNLVHVAKS